MFPFCPTALPTLRTSYCFDHSHFHCCEVLSHCAFDLHFSDYWYYTSFCVPVGHLYVFFRKMSGQVFACFSIGLFDFLLLIFMTSLYIWILTPHQINGLQIVSPVLCVDFVLCCGPLLYRSFLVGRSPTCLFLLSSLVLLLSYAYVPVFHLPPSCYLSSVEAESCFVHCCIPSSRYREEFNK